MSETIDIAGRVLRHEARALERAAELLDEGIERAADLILSLPGRVVTTGVGKSGSIAKKMAGTLASTGTPAFFLHPAEAPHGDFGMIQKGDSLLALSYSGTSAEILALLPYCASCGVPVIALTGFADSPLGKHSAAILNGHVAREADPHNLAPTTSATVALALGDALAIVLMERRKFTPEDFARYHPGGSLGRSLALVRDIMRTDDANPIVSKDTAVLDALLVMTGCRSAGVASVADADGRLVGLFTDGDLRRQLSADPQVLTRTVGDVMTPDPTAIGQDRLATEGLRILTEHKWDNLPVIDGDGRPVGILDVQDLLDARIL
ncbi:MAG: KpsF/GutQ family sugar-phosphate isomerase [Armatimonadia bacterium]|nr:KpsF/GutQ family sugar-phosphate isomerase [Armatimonadia bacterium]